jgi:hypothetical protein
VIPGGATVAAAGAARRFPAPPDRERYPQAIHSGRQVVDAINGFVH